MLKVAGYTTSQEQMEHWMETFFPEIEPFYVNDEQLLSELNALNVPIYSRQQFSAKAGDFIGKYGANYRHWDVPVTASIALLKAGDMADEVLRSKLFAHQADLNRGQIYTCEWIAEVDGDSLINLKENDSVRDGRIILTRDAWRLLPENIKQRWLIKWVEERIDSIFLDADIGPIPELSQRLVDQYAATFPPGNGANCFSASAGAYLGSSTIVENWLNVEQFYGMLKQEGLTNSEEISLTSRSICFRSN